MKSLQLQHAKASLSRIVEEVQGEGPVVITVRGREKAVVMSKRDYDRRVARQGSLLGFLRQSPLRGVSLDVTRDKSPTRKVEL
jgi:prevent-host-death family protein